MKNHLPILGVDKLGQDKLSAQVGTVIPFHTHCHTYFEMLFYAPFDGHITVNGQSVRISCPTVLLITPSDFHSTHPTSSGSTYYKLCFTEEQLTASRIPTCPLIVTSPDALTLLEPLFKHACAQPRDTAYLSALICAAVMTAERTGQSLASPKPLPALRLARDAVHIVSFEFTSELTLSDVAARLSVSPQHLSTVFSETVGMTFRDYLGDKRLRYAASLLLTDEANVSEACFLSGYRNLSHFVRAFNKKFGISPGKYRERMQISDGRTLF